MIGALLAASLACATPPGAEAVWARPETRILFIGEAHGTREIPAFAGDMLCAAGRPGAPALLALEAAPEDGQAEIDRYLASAGSEADRARLRRAPMWADPVARGSAAVLDLVERARQLGSPVVLIDVRPGGGRGPDPAREQGMAAALAKAAAHGRVVVLTGIGHADRGGFSSAKPPVAAAVQRLPPETAITLAPEPAGGQAWSCQGGGAERRCGPSPIRTGRAWARGVRLDPALRPGFDGLYAVGAPFTPSAPARQDPNGGNP